VERAVAFPLPLCSFQGAEESTRPASYPEGSPPTTTSTYTNLPASLSRSSAEPMLRRKARRHGAPAAAKTCCGIREIRRVTFLKGTTCYGDCYKINSTPVAPYCQYGLSIRVNTANRAHLKSYREAYRQLMEILPGVPSQPIAGRPGDPRSPDLRHDQSVYAVTKAGAGRRSSVRLKEGRGRPRTRQPCC
jgi:hypothetical protein